MRVYRFPNKRLIGQRQRKIAVVLLSEDLSEDIALCVFRLFFFRFSLNISETARLN